MIPSSSIPRVSVVICTRNRSADLARALDSLTRQVTHTPGHEVIVVDNGSTDGTREVVEGFAQSLDVRYVYEHIPGLCHARNAGWRSARGALVAYLDDDAVACPVWVLSVVEAFESMPETGAVGGRVDPVWQGARPRWLSDEIAMGLTIVNWQGGPRRLSDLDSEWLVGANMAIRRDLLHEVGGFSPELDRVDTKMLSSGDVFLLKQVANLGYGVWYEPAMAVDHLVPAARLTKGWFRSRYYWQGVSDVVMQLLEHSPSPAVRVSRGLSAAGRVLLRPRRWLSLFPTDDPDRFAEQCWLLIDIGQTAGWCGAAGGPRGKG